MRTLDFSRCALSSCVAAAMLAGCGGSQPPMEVVQTGGCLLRFLQMGLLTKNV
jgi:hypothetical protein